MSQPLPGEGFFFGGTCERGPSVFSHCATVQYWPMPHSVVPRLKYVDCYCYYRSGIVIMVNVITLYNCAVLTDAAFSCAASKICRLWSLSVIVISYCYQLLWSVIVISYCDQLLLSGIVIMVNVIQWTTVQYWPMLHSVVPRLKYVDCDHGFCDHI